MNWLIWIVVAAVAVTALVLLVRRFRSENHKLDGLLRDFDREHPHREPGSPSPARRLAGLRRAGNRGFGGRAGHRLS